MYLFPELVSGRGPTKSIPTQYQTFVTGMGCSSALGFCMQLVIRSLAFVAVLAELYDVSM